MKMKCVRRVVAMSAFAVLAGAGCASTSAVPSPETPVSAEAVLPAERETETDSVSDDVQSEVPSGEENVTESQPEPCPETDGPADGIAGVDLSAGDSAPDAPTPPDETAGDSEAVPSPESEFPPEEQISEPAPEYPEIELTPAQKMAAEGDFSGARKLTIKELREGTLTDPAAYWAIVDADPLFSHVLDEEIRPHGTNTLSALGGGSTVSLKYVDSADETAKAAIKPDQDLRQTMYRSEIAYHRLCQILECSYDTPVTRPARWTKSDFNALYNASTSKKNAPYRSKFEHLIWAKEDGQNYLYVAYKEWIPAFTGFPVEVTSAWSMYQRPGTTYYPPLDDFLRAAVAGGREDGQPSAIRRLKSYAGDMTTRDILRQLSDLMLIDYLTNNWDRFSGVKSNYGANCHFQDGGIVAIDNGAAFPAWHAPRVVKRLHLVKVFSRDLVQNLRMLDPDELLSRLIPNPTREEKKSYERFKERRRDALKYIDDLIAEYGEDNVLIY